MKNSPRFSLLRQITWATILGTGFGTIWFLLVIWLATALQEGLRGSRPKWPPREELVVRSDGTPLIATTRWEESNQITTTVRDLGGVEQAEPDREHLLPAIAMAGEHHQPDVIYPRTNWQQRLKPFINERDSTLTGILCTMENRTEPAISLAISVRVTDGSAS